MSKNIKRFDICNPERILGNIREIKFEESELKLIDAIKFRDSTDNDKFSMVLDAPSDMPKDAKLTTAKDQINYLANQINRTIEVKLLYNNLLEKFNEIEKRNHKLMEAIEKSNPEKVKQMEMQLEKFKLISESEIQKTNSEKRKLKPPNPKIDKNLYSRYAFIHENDFESLQIDQFEYVTISSEDWKLLNKNPTSTNNNPTSKLSQNVYTFQKSKLSTEGHNLKNLFQIQNF